MGQGVAPGIKLRTLNLPVRHQTVCSFLQVKFIAEKDSIPFSSYYFHKRMLKVLLFLQGMCSFCLLGGYMLQHMAWVKMDIKCPGSLTVILGFTELFVGYVQVYLTSHHFSFCSDTFWLVLIFILARNLPSFVISTVAQLDLIAL